MIESVFVKGNEEIRDFFIGKYPVTQEQWIEIMDYNPSYFKGDDHPVERVSWDDVQEFLKRLNNKYPGHNYRLPTEAEWEYAAKGGIASKGYAFSGSDDVNEVGWYYNNSDKRTHPVGELKPNELGIYGMSGNVWEWCDSESYYVVQGDSWYFISTDCRSSKQYSWYPLDWFNALSFRVVHD